MNLYIKAIGFEQVDSDFEEQMIHAGILDSLEKGLVIKNNELNRGAVIVRISESTGLYIYGRFKDKEFIYEYYFPFVIGCSSPYCRKPSCRVVRQPISSRIIR